MSEFLKGRLESNNKKTSHMIVELLILSTKDIEVDHKQSFIKGVSQLYKNEERRLPCTNSMHMGTPLSHTAIDDLT